MKWIKVKIDYYSESLKEAKAKLTNILEEVGIRQIEVVDYFSSSSLDYIVNPEKENSVWSMTGYIADNRFAQTKLNIIYGSLNENMEKDESFIYEIYISQCSDDDWKDEWKKYFHTVNITDNIVVKPSWDKYEAAGDEIVVEIDPGMAFGTGTHETTALCVEFLEKYSESRKKMIDIGCGSGILMLIAKKLGLEKVTGIDIDDKVLEVVHENFSKNGIDSDYEVIIGNLVEDIDEKYDLAVSNILVDVLTELLPNIEKVLENKATVIFSGILKGKEEQFLAEAEKYGLKEIDRNEKNNWISLVFQYR